MKNLKTTNLIFSSVYAVFVIAALVLLIPETIEFLGDLKVVSVMAVFDLLQLLVMVACIVTSFLGAKLQFIGGCVQAGLGGIGTFIAGAMCLFGILFDGYVEAEDILFFLVYAGTLAFSVGMIILGRKAVKAGKSTLV